MAHESDENGELARLFHAARTDLPTADDERRLMQALGARIGSGDTGNGGGESIGAPALRAKLGVTRPAAVAGVLAAGAALIVSVLYFLPPSAAPASPASDKSALSPPGAKLAPLAQPAAPSTVLPSAQPRAEPLVHEPPQQAKPVVDAPTKLKLRRALAPSEAALIERARSVVRRDPARALELTEQHKLAYRAGELSPEREVLAIEALARLGRRAEAVARANAFRASHPGSIHSSRIEAVLHEQTKRSPQ